MLTIRLLGDLAILRAGAPLPLPPSKKTRALLAYLVTTGRPQRRERLCNLLWDVPDDPRGALRWSLSKLRALVDEPDGGPVRIVADRDTVAFVSENAFCDLHALREVVGTRAGTAVRESMPTESLRAMADAISGMFLEGLDLPAQPDFQAWCLAEREDARRQHAVLLGALGARLAPDAPEEALPYVRQLVELDTFDPGARAMLVRLLARLNRREEAEQHCETGLRMLQEAGIPAGELSRAARELRRSVGPVGAEAPAASDPEPERAARPASQPDAVRTESADRGTMRQIIVVDDEPDLAALVTNYLTRHGYAARAATSGRALDALLAAETADLVVLDVNLPDEDGFAIARRLRTGGGPPILFLTAADDIVDRVAGLELGAEDYVTKPFDLRELRARIGVVLRRTAQAREATQALPADASSSPDIVSASGSASEQSSAVAQPERKSVTVLVAIIEDGADDGDEDVAFAKERLDRCVTVIRDAVQAQDGSFTATGPNMVTAVFGAPVAQEDAAASACFAALAMQETLRNSQWASGMALHVGLHAGTAVIRTVQIRNGVDAVGPVMRLTRRIAAAAPTGSVVLTPEIARQADHAVTTAPLGTLAVGTTDETINLFALTGRAHLHSRWDVRAARGLTCFLGRSTELEILGRVLSRAEVGQGQAVAIAGEPGIGKSRLVYEFLDTTVPPDWMVVATAATLHESSASYRMIGRLLRSWLSVSERETPDIIVAKLNHLIATRHALLQPHRAALAALLDLPGDDPAWSSLSPGLRRQAMQDALRATFVLTSQRQSLVLLLEDLHWADAPSLGLLDALVEGLAAQRILVLATFRPEHRPAWAGRSGTTQVRLDPLPAMDAETLLQSLLGDDATLTTLRRRLAARAEGIPLFLEEAVRGLADAGILSGTLGRYRLGSAAPAFVQLPSTIAAVVAARIDRLPPTAKALLQTASVIGREFPLILLHHVARLDPETLQTTLAELRTAEFLFESRLPPDTEYTFQHAMTQEAAYGSLLRDHRRALHVELVHAIEHFYQERLEEQVDRLAEHALAGELWPQAVQYLLRAANRAIERSAHAPAADLLQRGLEAMRHLPESPDLLRIELGYRKALGVTMMALKGWGSQEVSDAYTRARELSERLGDEQELFVVLCGQGQFYMMRGEPRTARALGEHCATLAESIRGGPGVIIETHHLLSGSHFFLGDYAKAEMHTQHGMALYDPERDHHLTYQYSGHDPGVCCRCLAGLVHWQHGHADAALERCREALALAERTAHPMTLAVAQRAMSYIHMFRREPAEARLWAERLIALCEDHQLPLLLSQGGIQLGWALIEQGDLQTGILQMRNGLTGLSATGAEVGLPFFAALLGEAYAKDGRPDQGIMEIDQALATAERNGAWFQGPDILRLKGELLRQREPDKAETWFRKAVATARAQGARLPELRAAISLARLLRSGSEAAAAREALATAFSWFTEGLSTTDLHEARDVLQT
ncbi:MAG: response regulator [Rhodopila sp.]